MSGNFANRNLIFSVLFFSLIFSLFKYLTDFYGTKNIRFGSQTKLQFEFKRLNMDQETDLFRG